LQRYVPVPAAGQDPVTKLDQPNLTLSVEWRDQDDGPIPGLAAFEQGAQYKAVISLTAKNAWKFVSGYPFAYYPSTSVLSQDDLTKTSDTNRVVYVTYKQTGNPIKVTNLDLTYHIPAPATGATAMWSVLGDGNQYMGSVQWEVAASAAAETEWTAMPSGVFLPGMIYRAVAALYPGPGCVFDENAVVSHDDAAGPFEPVTRTAKVIDVTISFPATIIEPVTDLDLSPYVPAPFTGGTPVTYFSAPQYTGNVAWITTGDSSPHSGLFKANTQYAAEVSLTAAFGYIFISDPTASSGSQAALSGAALSQADETVFEHDGGNVTAGSYETAVTIVFPATDNVTAGPVDELDLAPYVPAPALGGIPVTYFFAPQYTGAVKWTVTSSLGAHSGLFGANTAYTATVTLTAASGYTLEGLAVNGFTYAFSGAGGTITYNPATKAAVINFPQTTDVAAVPVTDLTLTGKILAPVNGGTPTPYFSASQYTGTVAWNPAAPNGGFGSGTAYTATVTLTAVSGHTFTGVGANAFTHGGGTASNTAGSGVVTILFPATPAMAVTDLDLTPYLSAPVAGYTAAEKLSPEPSQYTGAVTWTKKKGAGAEQAHSGKFEAGTTYKATVTLTAKPGYTFAKDTPFVYAKETIGSANAAGEEITVSIGGPSGTATPYPW
jgi:hypothetical protein